MRGFPYIMLGKFGNFIPNKSNSYVAENELFINQNMLLCRNIHLHT